MKNTEKSKKWNLTGEGMHITDWLEILGEHFPLVVIGCAEALLAVVLPVCCAAEPQAVRG